MKLRTLFAASAALTGLAFSSQSWAQAVPETTRGEYIARAADCVACHTDPKDGRAFAGGYGLKTPFGTLVASNITPDPETGIGSWTEEQFKRAVREGIGKNGEHLYAAMPYPNYTKMSDEDIHDLWVYIKTIAPVRKKVISNQLPFPYNIRTSLIFWNMLNFKSGRYVDDPKHSAEWNRGAYLVEALEHCNACHTPKNAIGGDKSGQAYTGMSLQGWYAPNITNSKTQGIGSWSKDDLQTYLKTGSNGHYVASGPMGEAVEHSTQYLTDTDLKAIATYFASIKGDDSAPRPSSLPDTDPQMMHGKAVYEVSCEACHKHDGSGVPGMITGFPNNVAIQAPVADSLIHTVLTGGRGAITDSNPTGAAMPAFAWRLDDAQIADVLTYIRNNWGNSGTAIKPETIAKMRADVNTKTIGPVPDNWNDPHFRNGRTTASGTTAKEK